MKYKIRLTLVVITMMCVSMPIRFLAANEQSCAKIKQDWEKAVTSMDKKLEAIKKAALADPKAVDAIIGQKIREYFGRADAWGLYSENRQTAMRRLNEPLTSFITGQQSAAGQLMAKAKNFYTKTLAPKEKAMQQACKTTDQEMGDELKKLAENAPTEANIAATRAVAKQTKTITGFQALKQKYVEELKKKQAEKLKGKQAPQKKKEVVPEVPEKTNAEVATEESNEEEAKPEEEKAQEGEAQAGEAEESEAAPEEEGEADEGEPKEDEAEGAGDEKETPEQESSKDESAGEVGGSDAEETE